MTDDRSEFRLDVLREGLTMALRLAGVTHATVLAATAFVVAIAKNVLAGH
jgi:hypothetical protein